MAYFQQKVYKVVIFLYFEETNTIDATQKFQLTWHLLKQSRTAYNLFQIFLHKVADSLIKQKIRGVSLVIYWLLSNE